jgi:DNA-binding HxlR family transcriptional regulator
MPRSYTCPVELALDLLGGKWRVVILAQLKQGPLRYADLRQRTPRISEKMLSQRLRELQDAGFIAKRRDRYCLAERGRSATGVLQTLYDWGQQMAPELGLRVEAPASRVEAPAISPMAR